MLEDRGDEMTIHGIPTPQATAALVAAAKARGWPGIRFYGGTPEWQRAARLEALRQGFPLDAISLDREDGQKPPVAACRCPTTSGAASPRPSRRSKPVPASDPTPAPGFQP